MRMILLGIALAVLPLSAVSAQAMNAEAFYQRAVKLKAKGAMAMLSMGELKALMREGKAAGQAASATHKADKAAGRPTRFCTPPGPQGMDSSEFLARLGQIPQADRRRITMTEATTRIMAAKFPCAKA